MNKEKIIDYLDKQFWKHKVYECMPENETGYKYVPRESLSKIVDGLISMIKSELKNRSLSAVSNRSEQYHCELYDFGRKDKPCDKQCDDCKAMNLD